jgi:hypothetical protein
MIFQNICPYTDHMVLQPRSGNFQENLCSTSYSISQLILMEAQSSMLSQSCIMHILDAMNNIFTSMLLEPDGGSS